MMIHILMCVVFVGFPMAFCCFVTYNVGYEDGYYKAKVEKKEQSK